MLHGWVSEYYELLCGQTNNLLRNCDDVVVFQPDKYSSMVYCDNMPNADHPRILERAGWGQVVL